MKMVAAILSVLVSTAAWSQAVDHSGPNPATKPMSPSPADVSFVKQLAVGGTAEVAVGKVASSRAQNAKVKEFAQQMVTDHSKTNAKLMSLAKAKNIDAPTKPDGEHTAKQAELEKLSGAAFDKKYMDMMVQAHQKTVQMLQQQISGGQDKDLRQFATEALPTVTHHLDMAKQLQASLGGGQSNMSKPGTPGTDKSGSAYGTGTRDSGSVPGTPATKPGSPNTPSTP